MSPTQIVEVRMLQVARGQGRPITMSGYFEDPEKLLLAVQAFAGIAGGTYITLNPVRPSLLTRAANRVRVATRGESSGDADIVRRRWLPIDLDPVRPSGISSTNEEHELAIGRAYEIREALRADGWPEPLVADSGNGAHLLYLIDIGADDDGLMKRCLAALATRFDCDRVKIDQAVFNPARIWKLYGTVSRKGDATTERPHRVSRILEGNPTLVSRSLLENLGGKTAVEVERPATARILSTALDLSTWLDASGFDVEGPHCWKGGQRWVFPVCPWNSEHQNRSAFVIQLPNGAISAGCHHNGCQGKKWADLRAIGEPGWCAETEQHVVAGNPPDWERPVLFHRHDLPTFPTEVFPGWLRDFVESLAVATQTPLDLGAMLCLSVLAASCAKKFKVQVKEGYSEPVNIFTVTALPSGNRKSAVFAEIAKPIEDYEQAESTRLAIEISRSEAAHKITESAAKRAREKAASADGENRQKLTHDACELSVELAGMVVKKAPRYIVDDCTPERLTTLLFDHGGRIAVMSPEGDVFEMMNGRYSDSGTGNFAVYLKGHAGDDLRTDRVNRPAEYVKSPALSVGLAVQPSVIEGLAQKPGFRAKGLLARFLYSLPASLLGYRDTDPAPVGDAVRTEFRERIFGLLNLSFAGEQEAARTANLLTLGDEAGWRFRQFEVWLEPKLAEFGELGGMTDWGGKLAGAVARIAGLLHLADHAGHDDGWQNPISSNVVERAICIGKYLIPHAKTAFADMGADPATGLAKVVLRWLQLGGLNSFTKRDLHQALRSRFERVADVDYPLSLLVQRGYIRIRPGKSGAVGRPASPVYDVNPLWNRTATGGSE